MNIDGKSVIGAFIAVLVGGAIATGVWAPQIIQVQARANACEKQSAAERADAAQKLLEMTGERDTYQRMLEMANQRTVAAWNAPRPPVAAANSEDAKITAVGNLLVPGAGTAGVMLKHLANGECPAGSELQTGPWQGLRCVEVTPQQ